MGTINFFNLTVKMSSKSGVMANVENFQKTVSIHNLSHVISQQKDRISKKNQLTITGVRIRGNEYGGHFF